MKYAKKKKKSWRLSLSICRSHGTIQSAITVYRFYEKCQGITNNLVCARLEEFVFGVIQKHKLITYLDTKCRRVVCCQRTVGLWGVLGQEADSMARSRFLAPGAGGGVKAMAARERHYDLNT